MGDGAEMKAVNCGEVGGAGVASMVTSSPSKSQTLFGLVIVIPLTTPVGRTEDESADPLKARNIHNTLFTAKGERTTLVACRREERHDTTALLTDYDCSPLLSFLSLSVRSQRTNEHRNIIATETTTTSFIGKGRKGSERAGYFSERQMPGGNISSWKLNLPGK